MAKLHEFSCGRVGCDSINRERCFIRSKPIRHVTSNANGVVSIENGEVWWVDQGGTRLCAEEPENNSYSTVYNLVNSLGKVRRTLNAHGRHRRGGFLVTRRSFATQYMAGSLSFEEYCTLSFKPDLPITLEHCEGGGGPSQR